MKYKHLAIEATDFKFDEEARTFEGYASAFNGVDAYGDTILPGAYEKTLTDRERPIRMRWNHFGPVIGKYLEIREDEKGLFVKGQLTPGHSVAEDAYASLRHGAVDGLSIGYRVPPGGAEENDEGGYDLNQIELIEISVVEEPADLGARIGTVKEFSNIVSELETFKDAEACLRDACGLSRSAAKAIVSQVKTLCQRDAGTESDSDDAVAEAVKRWRIQHALRLKSQTR